MQKILALGSGTMGNGIAQVCALSGFDVVLVDISEEILDRALSTIQFSLARMVKSGKLQAEAMPQVMARIKPSSDLRAVAEQADLVIEAVPERLDLKRNIFAELDSVCRPDAILASNTSELSITSIASATKRPERVIGMHWFNPPPVMRLIEIVRGLLTSDEVARKIEEISHMLGKETVMCKDSQGFIVTRALIAFEYECMRILEEGVASREDIDKALKLGLNHPMGPFELADYTGLDIHFHAGEGLLGTFGERFRPPQLLRQMVEAGLLGRKFGKGFYDYNKE
ncbi:MAG: 3-hydroxyacyl-CoA dehydrogenase family protein [Chloroflexota bacterium]|nr:MAG: 3-hydroxyacyl-CoA dehydrogenase family protein [Chloroflexota bacterium]